MWPFSHGLRKKMSSQSNGVITPGGGIAPGKHHIHPAYVVMNAIQIVLIVIAASFAGIMGAVAEILNSDVDAGVVVLIVALAGGAIVLLLALTLIFSYIYYKRFTWEITESEIHIYSGIFFKKQVHVPFQRVQAIDFHAGILQRILGIVKLKIDTAGGSMNRGVVIPALKLAYAEALRAEVFARKKRSSQMQEEAMRQKMQEAKAGVSLPMSMPAPASAPAPAAAQSQSAADKFVSEVGSDIGGLRGVFAEDYLEEAPVEYEHGLKAKELFLAAISGDQNLVILASLIGLATQIPELARLFGLSNTLEMALEHALRANVVPMVVGIIIVVFLVSLVLGVIGTAVSYGDFKARRRGGRIEVERGLLSRQSRGVAISRVQSVEITQGFIRRLIGYGELKLLTIDSLSAEQQQNGGQAVQQSGLVVHPFVKMDRIDEILAHLLPEFDERPQPAEYKTLPKVAFRRVINRHTILTALPYAVFALLVTLLLPMAPATMIPKTAFASGIVTWVIIILWISLVLMIIGRTIGAIMWYKNAAYSYNKTMLLIRQGFYGRTVTIIPRNKIQWAKTRQNPIQKMSSVASITAVTAAGIGGTKTKLRDLDAEEASAYLDWVRPRGNRPAEESAQGQ
jgi:putative membrane protein